MKEVTIKGKTYGFYEMKENMLWEKSLPNHITYILNNDEKITEPFYVPFFDNKDSIRANYQIISTTKDITEEQAENIVENNLHLTNDGFAFFKEYGKITCITYPYETAKDSLQSLIQSIGLDVSKNYLIIEKL